MTSFREPTANQVGQRVGRLCFVGPARFHGNRAADARGEQHDRNDISCVRSVPVRQAASRSRFACRPDASNSKRRASCCEACLQSVSSAAGPVLLGIESSSRHDVHLAASTRSDNQLYPTTSTRGGKNPCSAYRDVSSRFRKRAGIAKTPARPRSIVR